MDNIVVINGEKYIKASALCEFLNRNLGQKETAPEKPRAEQILDPTIKKWIRTSGGKETFLTRYVIRQKAAEVYEFYAGFCDRPENGFEKLGKKEFRAQLCKTFGLIVKPCKNAANRTIKGYMFEN